MPILITTMICNQYFSLHHFVVFKETHMLLKNYFKRISDSRSTFNSWTLPVLSPLLHRYTCTYTIWIEFLQRAVCSPYLQSPGYQSVWGEKLQPSGFSQNSTMRYLSMATCILFNRDLWQLFPLWFVINAINQQIYTDGSSTLNCLETWLKYKEK